MDCDEIIAVSQSAQIGVKKQYLGLRDQSVRSNLCLEPYVLNALHSCAPFELARSDVGCFALGQHPSDHGFFISLQGSFLCQQQPYHAIALRHIASTANSVLLTCRLRTFRRLLVTLQSCQSLA